MPSKRRRRSSTGGKKRGRSPSSSGKRPRFPISRKIEAHSRAVSTIGREKLKPGTYRVGKTRFITPTKRGMAVVREIEKTVRRVKDPGTITYSLEVKGPDGQTIRVQPRANIIPRSKRELRLKQRHEEGELSGAEYTRQLLDERVRADVFRSRVPMSDAQYQKYVSLRRSSAARARAFLQAVIRKTGVTFRVEVFREV